MPKSSPARKKYTTAGYVVVTNISYAKLQHQPSRMIVPPEKVTSYAPDLTQTDLCINDRAPKEFHR